MRNALFFLLFVIVAACGRDPQAAEGNRDATLEDYRGDWQGVLSVMTQELPVNLHVTPGADDEVTLDSPDQGLFGLPATKVEIVEGALGLEWETLGASYVGRIDDAGEAVNGEFSQGPITTELVFTRMNEDDAAKVEEAAAATVRPQEPSEPLPYIVEEVSLETTDGVTLAGTLTKPEGAGPFPAVVLLSGSGPQDRDEALRGHRPFFVLSDRLTRAGIATIRFDDRGVGGSGGSYPNTEFDRLGDDAGEMLALLRSRSDIAGAGILGHSEGGMVAGVAASRASDDQQPDFIVGLASPFAPLADAIIDQVAYAQRSSQVPDAVAEQNIALQRRLMEALVSSGGREEGCAAAKAILEPFGAAAQVEQLCGVQRFSSFLVDTEANFTAYNGPVLALFGGKDIQVVPATHAPVAERALAGKEQSEVLIIPNANHLFQTAETGDVSEYGKIETTMEEEVMQTIADFINTVSAAE